MTRCDQVTVEFGVCEICGRSITAAEDRWLNADIDFVEHPFYGGVGRHWIRRVRT